jgi:DNA polymerase-3 subunit alpha
MTKIVAIEEIAGTKLEPNLAQQIFDLILKFANYGFNRSHAAAYGMIGFQTAWLKAHHPHEFYAASMNLDLANIEKLAEFAKEMRRAGIPFSGPDVNKSQSYFSVEKATNIKKLMTASNDQKAGIKTKTVRWALSGIKGVGEQAMADLIAEREQNGAYKTFHDFVKRTGGKTLNKRGYENLIKAGALDSLHPNRAEMLFNLADVLGGATADQKSKNTGQASMFDLMPQVEADQRMKACQEQPRITQLQNEYDVLGMFISGHPIEQAEGKLKARKDRATIRQALDPEFRVGKQVVIGALLMGVRLRTTKAGEPMGILTISDPSGSSEAVMFPKTFARYNARLNSGEAFVVTCGVEKSKEEGSDERKLIVNDIESLKLDETIQKAA